MQTNEYVGALVGAGYIDSELNGSVSTTYWTRNVSNSSGLSILTIIVSEYFVFCYHFTFNHWIIIRILNLFREVFLSVHFSYVNASVVAVNWWSLEVVFSVVHMEFLVFRSSDSTVWSFNVVLKVNNLKKSWPWIRVVTGEGLHFGKNRLNLLPIESRVVNLKISEDFYKQHQVQSSRYIPPLPYHLDWWVHQCELIYYGLTYSHCFW